MNAMWIVIVLLNIDVLYGESLEKCCKFEQKLKRVKGEYKCVKDTTKRLQVLADDVDFLAQNSHGQCVDSDDDFFVFHKNSSGIFKIRRATREYFPKCCPVNYHYNTFTHSCEEGGSTDSNFANETYIKVGLTHCRIVNDHEFDDLAHMFSENSTSVDWDANASFCVDRTEKGTLVRRECESSTEICEETKCVKKCCPDGQSYINGSRCYDTYTRGMNLSSLSHLLQNYTDPFAIIHNHSCDKYLYREDRYNFSLDDKGIFHQYFEDGEVIKQVGNMNTYCIEHVSSADQSGYYFFMCFPDKTNDEKFQYTVWPQGLSCLFLTLTILVYLLLNETRKMFGKILVNYCAATLLQYAILTYASRQETPTVLDCQLRAFFIIFFASASFTWSNIMCCDIWCTFGSPKRYIGTEQRRRDLKKLMFYSLYGWGAPLLLTLIILLFYKVQILPMSIQPCLAEVRCFFDNIEGNYSKILFFNLPLLLIEIANIVLFIKTVMYCLHVQSEIDKINDDDKTKKFHGDRERLSLILKLLVIMGVSFIFEVVSAFFNMSEMGSVLKYTEIVWDFINALQGVFIFIIFICKRKILERCIRKFKSHDHTRVSVSSSRTHSSVVNALPMNGVK